MRKSNIELFAEGLSSCSKRLLNRSFTYVPTADRHRHNILNKAQKQMRKFQFTCVLQSESFEVRFLMTSQSDTPHHHYLSRYIGLAKSLCTRKLIFSRNFKKNQQIKSTGVSIFLSFTSPNSECWTNSSDSSKLRASPK